mmetsp:Transcript_42011/g.48679  ORF Transcript_42011/g.48679 Transcript_42011/m.48679 type:complete len:162 (+) Transcript_42011:1118-1603(+)
MIIKFFEGLEKYGIKFESSQKRMLVTPGNTLVLGRSGTGKTTVSAFKMLAIDLLFKTYSKMSLTDCKKVVLEPEDLTRYKGCGIVFCTASPVLTNEVRRFYKELELIIKEHLQKKHDARERVRKQKLALEESKNCVHFLYLQSVNLKLIIVSTTFDTQELA